jgi:cytosine deaminase
MGAHNAHSLLISKAALRPKTASALGIDGLADIRIEGNRIAEITPCRSPESPGKGPDEAQGAHERSPDEGETARIDADGGLVTESFVNGHLHLCKVNTLALLGDDALSHYHSSDMGGAMTAIEIAAAVKREYRTDRLLPGIRVALEQAIAFGTSHIRAFADTDTTAGLEGVHAVMEARDEYRDRVEVQVVAFPQDGLIRDPGAENLVRAALEEGADVVGGIPWIEYTDDASKDHISKMLDLAIEFDRDISMLVDDAGDPGLRTLEELALQTIARSRHGRVTAQHARAMSLYPTPYLLKLIALLKQARIGIICDPHTGPLHARVDELREHGVPVGLGQDDIADAYYPFGRNNMAEVGFLAAHLLWKTSSEQLEAIYDMITTEAATVLNISDHRLESGGEANLIVHRHPSVREVFAHHQQPSAVIHRGRVVARG